jgi:hypothetical protein
MAPVHMRPRASPFPPPTLQASLSDLALPPEWVQQLAARGVRTARDALHCTPTDLAEMLDVAPAAAGRLLSDVAAQAAPGYVTVRPGAAHGGSPARRGAPGRGAALHKQPRPQRAWQWHPYTCALRPLPAAPRRTPQAAQLYSLTLIDGASQLRTFLPVRTRPERGGRPRPRGTQQRGHPGPWPALPCPALPLAAAPLLSRSPPDHTQTSPPHTHAPGPRRRAARRRAARRDHRARRSRRRRQEPDGNVASAQRGAATRAGGPGGDGHVHR